MKKNMQNRGCSKHAEGYINSKQKTRTEDKQLGLADPAIGWVQTGSNQPY
jgi:hypothetical protein